VAISADGTYILWRTGTGRILVSGTTAAFIDVRNLPGESIIAADKKDASIFYGAYGSSFYISKDAGRTFSRRGTLGSSSSPHKIAVHPTVAGDVWVSTNTGLFHSTNFGAKFKPISNVSQAWGIALGAPPSSGRYPAVFAVAKISGTGGIYRSDNTGVKSTSSHGDDILIGTFSQTSWVKINDAQHGFSNYNSAILAADPRQYGRWV
jgi:xyloglucan-specific exo-beta-1,4-glucanase